jgi:hypothetical protein
VGRCQPRGDRARHPADPAIVVDAHRGPVSHNDRFGGSTHPEAFGFVPDPADRKFAALADAVQVPLVTSDAGLLNAAGQMAVRVLKPSEFALRSGVTDI